MLLLAFLIVGFGLRSAKGTSEYKPEEQNDPQIYEAALKMVSMNSTLRLLMFSRGFENKIPQCLFSKFLLNEESGPVRTLQTDFINNKTSFPQLNSTVHVTVSNSTPPYLQINFKEVSGHYDSNWTYAQDLKYANAEECILLQDASGKLTPAPCTLWGYGLSDNCRERFKQMCGAGNLVNLTQCTQDEKKKGEDTLMIPQC
uniref:Putative secreted protein 94 n=1 Tax=Amblyomma parvum TaxID=251391 RepID=A0A023FZ08_AMBPA